MVDPQVDGCRHSSGAQAQVQKAFDIRAKCRLELELRLDRFGDALDARNGRGQAQCKRADQQARTFADVERALILPDGAKGVLPARVEQ